MKQEEKLQDLCARLPYGFFIHRKSDNSDIKINDIDDFAHFLEYSNGEEFKPYLRSMSSMTEEERNELLEHGFDADCKGYIKNGWMYSDAEKCNFEVNIDDIMWLICWLNAHHLDWRGLIPKGLALEAPEGMYK